MDDNITTHNDYLSPYLDVGKKNHFLDSSSAVHWQTEFQGLSSIHQEDEKGLGVDKNKTGLVQLDTKSLHVMQELLLTSWNSSNKTARLRNDRGSYNLLLIVSVSSPGRKHPLEPNLALKNAMGGL